MSPEVFEAKLAASAPSGTERTWSLIRWGRGQIDPAMDAAGVENIVRIAHDLYDKYVVPLDLPLVPSAAEPLVDSLIKEIIARLIRSVHDAVHSREELAALANWEDSA